MTISRRQALLAGAIAASFAAPVAVAEYLNRAADDADLMRLVGTFHQSYQTTQEVRAAWSQARQRADAMPDCPSLGGPIDVWRAFMDKHGAGSLYDEWCRCSDRSGALARDIFAIPAGTLAGAVEKFKIARLADDDHDLEMCQDFENPWMGGVLRDLERLAGEVPS